MKTDINQAVRNTIETEAGHAADHPQYVKGCTWCSDGVHWDVMRHLMGTPDFHKAVALLDRFDRRQRFICQ